MLEFLGAGTPLSHVIAFLTLLGTAAVGIIVFVAFVIIALLRNRQVATSHEAEPQPRANDER